VRILSFTVEGKVKRCTGKEKYQNISATYSLSLDREDHDCTNAYIQSNENGYSLYLTGKNGIYLPS
jgi:hypothetical protein